MLSDFIVGHEFGLAVDGGGNVYVADVGVGVRLLRGGTGTAQTIAGGVAHATALAVDPAGTTLFAVDHGHETGATTGDGVLYRIDVASGTVQKLRDNLRYPQGVALDLSGTRLFVAEEGGKKVVELDPGTGQLLQDVATSLGGPTGITVDKDVDVFIQDGDACVIRKVEKVPAYVPPSSTPSSVTPDTVGGGDRQNSNLTAPTIPTGQTGSQTQGQGQGGTAGDALPAGAGSRGDAAFGGDAVGFTAGRSGAGAATDLGGLGTAGGFQGAPNVVGSLQPGVLPTPISPPPPAAAPGPVAAPGAVPASPLVSGGHGAPAAANVGVPAPGGQLPRPATRYAMVARGDDATTAAAVAGVCIVALFGGAVALAARLDGPAPARASRTRCRPKGAY
jgi:hypothetical protein